ncbi:SEC14 domain and spectrin repeat-containing protein 1 isoform X1 [Rhinatrema bivittatum]|uniref:SEC14 domain and spectrin repeat-containing protein 1 isoform X1 n=1 Tax=Rhinatrema bivittatum TaxID=194408 RepID=UPI001126E9D7|nr:SEC14 domain and spectrin repeat-containing protein 1 isoform X1 [Rhinatrema bivittatum]XP_029461764.1 SEC14 domain and spectrin repeat-containing protein 1 isoform X1 [Rhinatrema bivittatum]XP_029461765.1 SEC14 domain and spectrin repeat-containing protein 1 isoform X1 [Rhinatrema bivittatum]XP_029461766.1 SEC14 domain and spectrin repeat-containing protein 1 isoform X1 [Rhinatrema bivittatum]
MDATVILPILKKKLAFLSGGKDRRSGLILTIPLCFEQTSMDELSVTLDYLLSIPSEKCKARGFTVIVDGRKSQWNVVKTVVLMLQNVVPAEVSLVCVVKPDEFWDKKVTHFCFWKEKDRLGFEVILVSANKLTRYIEPCQLTEEFGGSLTYDHMDWLNKRLVFEKFTKESTSLLDELSVINNGSEKGSQEKERSMDFNFLPSVDPETVLQTGHELLSELQQRRFNGSESGGSWSPMDDELLAQPQVMKLLDSLREQYTRYQEVCRQRSKRTQLEEIQQKVMQVVNWLEGPGSEQLRTQWGIGDSIRASQALQQKHEEIESQHSEWFAVYVELNQQIAALLNAGDEEDLVELKALQQQLSDVCYRQASQLEFRQNLLQAALEFHGVAQDLSQQLDGLLGMLCVDVAPTDGAAIQQTLKLLEEKLKSVDSGLQGLREKGQGLLDQITNQASWAYGKDVSIENKENVDHIQGIMEDMQLRKQRCEDMVDVRRLKMLQMVQLFKCEEDASQAVEWLNELLDALLKTHIRLGDDVQETKILLEKHRKFVDVAQSTYDYGRQLLQATVVLCQSLRCTSRSSGDTLPRLNRVWKQFMITSEERIHRLDMAIAFHSSAEKILQDCPEQPETITEMEQFDEVEAVGKSLLDRLTIPVLYPDGTEQYFGSPSDMASTAEHIRERMKLVNLKKQQLRDPESTTTES